MDKPLARTSALALAAALLVAPAPGAAIAPALLMMARQAGSSMLKDMLLGSVRDSGCKGAALSNALQGFDPRKALLGGGMAVPGLPGGGGMADMAAMKGRLDGLMPAGAALPPGVSLAPEQMAMLAQMQQAMAAPPLSPAETLATLDELGELGLAPPAMLGEMKECMVLLPQSAGAMGMGLGMLRPMLGQMRSAREQMRALPPEEQDELAARMAEELRGAPADERREFLEAIGSGFLPPRVVEGLRSRLGGAR
jgi:hypothetical protein